MRLKKLDDLSDLQSVEKFTNNHDQETVNQMFDDLMKKTNSLYATNVKKAYW